MDRDRLFIDGGWAAPASAQVMEIVSPATEEVIARIPDGTSADIDLAVAAARRAFDTGPWPRMSPDERADVLAALSAALKTRTDALADAISAQVGTPRSWAAFGQVGTATAVYDAHVVLTRAFPWSEERAGFAGSPVVVSHLPAGVVGAIVPWNSPQFTAAMKLAPALAAGCTVVLKPSPLAPLDCYLLAEAAAEVELPPGVLNIVAAGALASEHLVTHPDVDKISFTGSTAVGRRIGALCGADVRRCTLELGGKSAAILLDDVDLSARTVKSLVAAAMSNNGQVCAAQTRVLAPRSRYDEVVGVLAEAVGALRTGDPFDAETEVGPLASSAQRDRVEGYLAAGRREGARAVAGGGRPSGLDRGWYVEPTVLADVDNRMTVAREEIFGPVVAVIPYDGDDDAVATANDSPYGLTGSVWTTDPDRGAQVAASVRAGVVSVNSLATMDFNAPFGGFKQSGIGRELGPEGIRSYTEYQSILLPKRR